MGKIVKVWAGLGKEVLGLHKFEVQFPDNSDVVTKARLIGAMFLMNELFFRPEEGEDNWEGAWTCLLRRTEDNRYFVLL